VLGTSRPVVGGGRKRDRVVCSEQKPRAFGLIAGQSRNEKSVSSKTQLVQMSKAGNDK